MARVCVVFPSLSVSPDFIDYPYFADLGAIQAAAVLRAAGHDVSLSDALALGARPRGDAKSSRERLPLGAAPERVLANIPAELDVAVVALTPFHRPPSRDAELGEILAALAARARAPRILLADLYTSGQHVVDAPSAEIVAAYPEADALLRYEAEGALPALVARLAASPRRAGAPEIVIGDDLEDLDALPLPAWDLVDLEAYWAMHDAWVRELGRPRWAFPIDERSVPVITSRGCPFRCVHCSSNPRSRIDGVQVHPKTQRRHSAAYLDRLLGDLAARGARRVHVLDELANVNRAHFDGVLDAIERHRLKLEIPNGLRADYVGDAQLDRMRGRITTLSVSAESGVQAVVDRVVDKQLDLADIDRVAAAAAERAIPMLVHFIIGLVGETKADINRTLEYALHLFEDFGVEPSVQFATPLPGTRLAALARGRSLPVVADFGPRFQQQASIATDAFTLEELERFKWTFDLRIAAARGPKKVILNATYKCNNRCTFCATGTRTQFDGDFGKQRELLVKYRRAGVRLLDIDGGEPTLNPNLFALVGFARRIGYDKVNVTTNGRLASYRDFATELTRSGVTSVLVSIHGPDAQTHAQNVGVAEAFDQTCAGVRNLVAVAPADVELGANVTITKSNHKKLVALAELVLDLGLKWFNLQFLTPFGRATSSVSPDTEEAAREVMALIDRFGDRMKFQVINLPFCFMPGYERHLVGDLLKLERHMLFVNNDEVNLFEYLRERRMKKPVCEGCPHAIFCGGFYELSSVPEPTWLIRPEDLVRPLRDELG
ncbi:MAG: radical SAM protein [Polyangiaceae bacterium]